MVKLLELIHYWKGRQESHPPIPLIPWDDALTATIVYLEKLNRIKEVSK